MKLKNKMGLLVAVIFGTFLLTGCDLLTTGEYTEGTYFGYNEDTATVVAVYVGSNSKIQSIILDRFDTKDCYTEEDSEEEKIAICTGTSKRILGLEDLESTTLPWYKQSELIAEKVIEMQDLDWLEFRYQNSLGEIVETKPSDQTEDDMIYTDTIADIDMAIDDIYNAINSALEDAKK